MTGRGTRALTDPPGGVLMWIVVTLELVVFALVAALVGALRVADPDVFRAGQDALDASAGVMMTLALVTSGWLAAEAVHAYRTERPEVARRWYAAAVAVGLVFVAIKISDYATKLGAGHRLGSSDFWDAYFLGTGFHFAHVLVGLVLLGWAATRVGRGRLEDPETVIVGSALFWHMCDIAWFFLFPLFYLRS